MRRRHRIRRTLLLGGIVGVVVLAGIILFPATVTRHFEMREVIIPKGASIDAIAAILEHEGLVGNTRLFVLAARVLGYDRNLQAGRFTLPVGSSTYRILHQLAKGMSAEDMVRSGDCVFIATGITSNALLPAPERTMWGWRTHSLVVTPRHPGLFVEALPGPLDPADSDPG